METPELGGRPREVAPTAGGLGGGAEAPGAEVAPTASRVVLTLVEELEQLLATRDVLVFERTNYPSGVGVMVGKVETWYLFCRGTWYMVVVPRTDKVLLRVEGGPFYYYRKGQGWEVVS